MRPIHTMSIALILFAGTIYTATGKPDSVPDRFENLVFEGKDSYCLIQDEAMRCWNEETNSIALALARQTMYGLDQDVLLKFAPPVPSRYQLSSSEQEWLGFIEQQADAGNPFYQEVLGIFYYLSIGVNLDIDQAMTYCTKSAEQGLPLGQRNLGTLYELYCHDYQKAAGLYRKAGEQGLMYGWYNLGKIYSFNDFEGRNMEEAMKYWKVAAEGGFSSAQLQYGQHYLEFHPQTPTHKRQRDEWLKKAALQGNIEAIHHLYYFCGITGFGYSILDSLNLTVPEDKTKALEYLVSARKSCRQGLGNYLVPSYDCNWKRGFSLEYLSDIVQAGILFPEVMVDHKPGKAEISKYTMNSYGCGIDGIRFTLPPKRGEFHFIIAAPPGSIRDHIISPSYLDWIVALDPLQESTNHYGNAPWPENYRAFFGHISNSIKPDRENTLALLFNSNHPVDVYVGFSLAPQMQTCTIAGFSVPLPPNDDGRDAFFGLERNYTPNEMLTAAASSRDIKFIDYAIAQGADIKKVPVLALALENQRSLDKEVLVYMLKLGADPNVGLYGRTAIHALYMMGMGTKSMYEKPETVRQVGEVLQMFIQAGGNINAQDLAQCTPLMYSVYTLNPEIVRQLLERGADASIKQEDDLTVFDWCESERFEAVRKMLIEFTSEK